MGSQRSAHCHQIDPYPSQSPPGTRPHAGDGDEPEERSSEEGEDSLEHGGEKNMGETLAPTDANTSSVEEEASKDGEDENSAGGESEDSSEEEEDPMGQTNNTIIPGHSLRSASSCVAKVGGSPWIGSLDSTNKELPIRFLLGTGRLGEQKILIRIRISTDKSVTIVEGKKNTYYEIFVEVSPGFRGS
jgi:hypothetical protein